MMSVWPLLFIATSRLWPQNSSLAKRQFSEIAGLSPKGDSDKNLTKINQAIPILINFR
jgi:hypothetical protein